MAGLSVCGQVEDTFLSLFLCFLFNMGTILSVLFGKGSRSWHGFFCSVRRNN